MMRLSCVALSACLMLSVSTTAEAQKWTDGLSLDAFVDAYAVYTSHKVGSNVSVTPPGISISDGTNKHRAYIFADGFGLSFAGLDASVNGAKFGATLSLRFGPSVVRFFGDNGPLGFDNLTQAYLSWTPLRSLTVEFGQFGTIYGAEVAESWQNINYSRGVLYFTLQPRWHVGLRANYAINDTVGLTGLIVNGTNNLFEDNTGPSLGLQLSLSLDSFEAYVGWLGTTVPNDSAETLPLFDNFFDLVATVGFGDFSALLNVSYTLEDSGGQGNALGASAALAYAVNDTLGIGARGEYLSYLDSDCAGGVCPNGYDALLTGTLTLDIKPIRRSANLILRPEVRVEKATDDAFVDDGGAATDTWWAVMLGAVVTTR